jgi:hypothetical protein
MVQLRSIVTFNLVGYVKKTLTAEMLIASPKMTLQTRLHMRMASGLGMLRRLTKMSAALGVIFFANSQIDPSVAQTARPSAITCDNYARDYANQSSRQGQVLRGGAVGSLVGLGLGSIGGAAGVGAAVGATVGMIGGGMRRSSTADRTYNAAYQDCMSRH